MNWAAMRLGRDKVVKLNGEERVIEGSVEVPPTNRGRNKGYSLQRATAEEMEVGDSTVVSSRKEALKIARELCILYGDSNYPTRRTEEGFRVWRL